MIALVLKDRETVHELIGQIDKYININNITQSYGLQLNCGSYIIVDTAHAGLARFLRQQYQSYRILQKDE
jgi:hypothetical protein